MKTPVILGTTTVFMVLFDIQIYVTVHWLDWIGSAGFSIACGNNEIIKLPQSEIPVLGVNERSDETLFRQVEKLMAARI